MNYIQKAFSDLVEENGGTVLSVSPFTFSGPSFVVGVVEYFGHDCVLSGSVYTVASIVASSAVTPVVPVGTGMFQSDVFQSDVFQI